jgi:hypothetical protein
MLEHRAGGAHVPVFYLLFVTEHVSVEVVKAITVPNAQQAGHGGDSPQGLIGSKRLCCGLPPIDGHPLEGDTRAGHNLFPVEGIFVAALISC